jgi:hypothetical protein
MWAGLRAMELRSQSAGDDALVFLARLSERFGLIGPETVSLGLEPAVEDRLPPLMGAGDGLLAKLVLEPVLSFELTPPMAAMSRERTFSRGSSMGAFGHVTVLEFPVLGRIIESFLQPGPLFLLRDMEEHLDDGCSLIREHLFEIPNVFEASLPHVSGHKIVDPHHQHIFVMAAIEDGDATIARRLLVNPPEVVMGEFDVVGAFEVGHTHTKWVDGVEHMLDGSVLA